MDFEKLRGKRVCVAVSGGADSVALMHYLRAQAETFSFSLCAVNCEHGIRGEASLADTRFVQTLCEEWRIPLFCFSEDCLARSAREKKSLETVAREFRYESFERLFKAEECDYVALAHHANDEAETLLFRLCRGSSLTGAGAMKKISGRYLRPFLRWSKAEILSYAQEHGLAFRTDESNFEKIAARNRIRLDVLPILEEIVPNATENLSRFAERSQADDEYLYELAKPLLRQEMPREEGDTGVRLAFCQAKPLFFRACLTAFKKLGFERDYTEAHLESVYGLQTLQTGSKVSLKGGLVAKRTYDELAFYQEKDGKTERERFFLPFLEGSLSGGEYEIVVSKTPIAGEGKTLRIDERKIPPNAIFRLREEGDVFEKFGGGRKTLKKYLIDKKIPAYERERLPVLASGKEILVVCGVEISEKLKTDERTENTVYIAIKKKE